MDNIKELIEFFKNINIPKIEKKETTFLEIAGLPHYENVISNIYAFYLNPYEKHKLEDIFISSLLMLIEKKTQQKKITISKEFEIEREKVTENKKRIDLLIYDKENVIIIESKIFHNLNNPLEIYWNSNKIPKVEDEHKIGIILSLWHQNTKNDNYINITHIEWLEKVFENIENYKQDETNRQDETNKYFVILKDFYQNIKNLTNKMKTEEIDFFRNNVIKINQAVELKFGLRNHIVAEVERACGLLNKKLELDKIGNNKYNQKRLRYYRSKKFNELVITIVFEELLTEKGELYIVVELQHKLIKKIQEKYDEIIKDFQGTLNESFKTVNKNYAHFAHIPNCKPNSDEIKDLSKYIVQQITDNHILEIFNKLEQYLDN